MTEKPLRNVIKYFKDEGVQLVVRLNEKLYDGAVFEEQGMKHVEMVRPRTCPPPVARTLSSSRATVSTFQTVPIRRNNT